MINLRPYQNEARYQVNTLLNASRHPVIVSATGSGKSVIGTAIIQDRIRLNKRTFIFTPQDEIFQQWVKHMHKANIDFGMINSEGIKGRNKLVYICMPFSLFNLLPYLPESIYPDEICVDECHMVEAYTYQKIQEFFPQATRWGMTATPYRLDGKGLDNTYTDIVQTITMKECIDAGYLAKPLTIVPEEYDIKVGIKNGDYDPEEQAKKLGEPKIIGNVIQEYERLFSGLPVFGACCTYQHAKMMTEKFNSAGWNFRHLHSKLQIHERRKIISDIRNKKINGICTVGIGIAGLDIPGLFGLIWLRRTMSLTIFLQLNGRILRPLPGKKYGIILDMVGNTFIHGLPDAYRKWSLKGQPTEQRESGTENEASTIKICSHCKTMNSIDNIRCHFCNGLLDEKGKGRKIPTMIDGELIILDSKNEDNIDNLKKHIEEVKLKQQEEIKKEEERKKIELEELSVNDSKRMSILKDGIFKNKRKIFQNTIKNFM